MRLVLTILFLFALLETGAVAASPPKQQFTSPQDVLRWINGYRHKSDPKRVPEAVRAMSALGLFKDLDAGGVYVGFMAGVLADHPDTAESLISKMFPLPADEQVVLIRAIAYSGLPEWKTLLIQFAERMPARKVLISRHLADKLPTLMTLPLDQSAPALDTLWGFYFATGRFESVDRIIATLAWAKDGNNVDRLTLGNMAKWTLANNALQDKELLDHLSGEVKRRPKEVQRELVQIIEAAETFETSKIRKEAFAAIEELKRKGPESARNVSWWGTAGQTALAVGCVVAGAMGHVEIGLPCVLGGAASSAALKFMTPQ
jgi:hypothetical protein